MADGAIVLEAVVFTIIYPSFMAKITWTGRAGKGQAKKIALSKYSNVINLIFDMCYKADQSYSHKRCLEDLKYKIIKYAHSKYSNSATETTSKQTEEVPIISVATTPEASSDRSSSCEPVIIPPLPQPFPSYGPNFAYGYNQYLPNWQYDYHQPPPPSQQQNNIVTPSLPSNNLGLGYLTDL